MQRLNARDLYMAANIDEVRDCVDYGAHARTIVSKRVTDHEIDPENDPGANSNICRDIHKEDGRILDFAHGKVRSRSHGVGSMERRGSQAEGKDGLGAALDDEDITMKFSSLSLHNYRPSRK